ncbi:MAG: anti-anti-sigma factor [Crocinitomicaceae bacterium]|jgi:anti-anti-sigma factor|nr:anti-anti-sigma factor [Crocinitomicaceae bacterium]
MNFEVSQHSSYVLVKSKVEKLDVNTASDLKSELVLLNKKGNNSIVLDLSETKYCDSSGLSAILMANRLCKDSSGEFVLAGLNSTILKLIQIAQLDKVLTIKSTPEEVSEIKK